MRQAGLRGVEELAALWGVRAERRGPRAPVRWQNIHAADQLHTLVSVESGGVSRHSRELTLVGVPE